MLCGLLETVTCDQLNQTPFCFPTQGLWQVPLPANVPSSSESTHPNSDRVGVDGLPHVGAVVHPGEVYYSAHDWETGAMFWSTTMVKLDLVTFPPPSIQNG